MNQETTKTKIVATFLVIAATLFLLAGLFYLYLLVLPLISPNEVVSGGEPLRLLVLGVFGIGFGVFNFIVADRLHKLKKWAYIVVFAQFSFAALGNLIYLVKGDVFMIAPLALGIGVLALLYLDRNTFFKNVENG